MHSLTVFSLPTLNKKDKTSVSTVLPLDFFSTDNCLWPPPSQFYQKFPAVTNTSIDGLLPPHSYLFPTVAIAHIHQQPPPSQLFSSKVTGSCRCIHWQSPPSQLFKKIAKIYPTDASIGALLPLNFFVSYQQLPMNPLMVLSLLPLTLF